MGGMRERAVAAAAGNMTAGSEGTETGASEDVEAGVTTTGTEMTRGGAMTGATRTAVAARARRHALTADSGGVCRGDRRDNMSS
jgi:hypothetical protein